MPSTIWRSVSSFCTGFPLRSAFVDAENDQSTPTCPERIRRRPPEHPLGKSWAPAERASGRLRFLSTVKRSPIRKRGGSDNLAEMLAHHCRGPEPCFCGEPFHRQLRCFEQALRTTDARAGNPVGGSRTNLCAEVTAQRSCAHGGLACDDGKREILAEIPFDPREELAN